MSKTKYDIFSKKPPTEDFVGCFMGGGGPNAECTCGRVHVAIDSQNLEEESRLHYIAQHKANPEGYILHFDCDYVHYVEINLRSFVDDCPCNGPRVYEDMFWRHRKEYKNYLTIVKMKLLAQAADVGEWTEDV